MDGRIIVFDKDLLFFSFFLMEGLVDGPNIDAQDDSLDGWRRKNLGM
jgi:hypothetical protein